MSTYERRYTYCEHNMHASIFLLLQVTGFMAMGIVFMIIVICHDYAGVCCFSPLLGRGGKALKNTTVSGA